MCVLLEYFEAYVFEYLYLCEYMVCVCVCVYESAVHGWQLTGSRSGGSAIFIEIIY